MFSPGQIIHYGLCNVRYTLPKKRLNIDNDANMVVYGIVWTLTLLMPGDLRAPSSSLKATFMANWMARPVMVPVDSGSILDTALTSAALVLWDFRETSFFTRLA